MFPGMFISAQIWRQLNMIWPDVALPVRGGVWWEEVGTHQAELVRGGRTGLGPQLGRVWTALIPEVPLA